MTRFSHHDTPAAEPSIPPISMGGEGGLGRRSFLGGAAAFVVATFVLKENVFEDNKPTPKNPADVLLDPEKATAFVGKFEATATSLAEDKDMPMPYEIFLAVGMHESDSGTSELAEKANNMHGIVAKDGWEGEVYKKPTEETIPQDVVGKLAAEHGKDLHVLYKNKDGTIRVKYPRLFRKYDKPEDSFADFQKKIYFQNKDGSYRYADVISYLKGGGRDPHEVARLMVDKDEPGELVYATGAEWLSGTKHYIELVQGITGNTSSGTPPTTDPGVLPKKQNKIDLGLIDFEGLKEPRDKRLVETMKAAIGSLTAEDYRRFRENGIEKKWGLVKSLIGEEGYNSYYNGDRITVEYLIWHCWAYQVADGDTGTSSEGPKGQSHNLEPSKLIQSWANNKKSSTQFMLPDAKHGGKVWQLAQNPATQAGHIRSGIMDEARAGREDVSNHNTIAIESQLDSVYDAEQNQFRELILWTTGQLFEQGLIKKSMTRKETDAIIEQKVVGHGKNGGLEFGQRYAKPLKEAIKQYVFIVVQS